VDALCGGAYDIKRYSMCMLTYGLKLMDKRSGDSYRVASKTDSFCLIAFIFKKPRLILI